MLTKKQKDLLGFIHERMQEADVPPSFEEMKAALGLKSKSGIHRLIMALEERGYIQRLPHRARALEIVRLPDGLRQGNKTPSPHTPARASQARHHSPMTGFHGIPLLGKIAAGSPIEAISSEGPSIEVPSSLLGKGDHYALTVDGESMIDAGIHNGDTVIIRKCDSAENGTIVVAFVDGAEVTLKRLRRAGNKIVLEPENAAYEPQILEPERVSIQGRLVGLVRSYH